MLPILRLTGRALGLLTRRVALLAVLLVGVFASITLLPRDAAQSTLERGVSADVLAAQRAQLGLDQPLIQRFARWVGGLFTGDLGTAARGQPVADVVLAALPNTVLLGGLALGLTVIVAVTVACLATLRPGGPVDRLIAGTATVTLALPEFVVASMLVLVFALWANLLPAVAISSAGGAVAPQALILPVLAVAIPQLGWNVRLVRAALADEARAPHVDAAQLDGLSRTRLLVRHLLPGVLPAVATAAVTSVGLVLGGAIVVEAIFNYPGVGVVLAQAVQDRDAPLVAGVVALTGVLILGLLLLADAVRAWATWGTR
ncbi:MAG: ABC transporter permease [Actinomycetota bacterium]|nr:ABC transporter permease [Actinomycetota bacterium]